MSGLGQGQGKAAGAGARGARPALTHPLSLAPTLILTRTLSLGLGLTVSLTLSTAHGASPGAQGAVHRGAVRLRTVPQLPNREREASARRPCIDLNPYFLPATGHLTTDTDTDRLVPAH